jgi:5-deoxy-glucuronate isomerase
MPNLLLKPSAPDAEGRIHAVTPASAGWTYVGFEVFRLRDGQTIRQETGGREACLVML